MIGTREDIALALSTLALPPLQRDRFSDARPLAILHCRGQECGKKGTVLVDPDLLNLDYEGYINSYYCQLGDPF